MKNNKKQTKKITRYFCETKEKDICCEDHYKREEIVEHIVSMYKEIYNNTGDNYLDWIDNDIVRFIGARILLANDKNKKGVKLWDFIDSTTKNKDITNVLMELPLYYLLSFLGATYLMYVDFLNFKK